MKTKAPQYICQNCSKKVFKWVGRCSECHSWNSFENLESYEQNLHSNSDLEKNLAKQIHDISHEQTARISTGICEFDRVLGGGIVPGSLVLVGGDPGVGKSTLLTIVFRELEKMKNMGPLLYVSGEESVSQVAARFNRLAPNGENFWVLHENELERIFSQVDRLSPKVVVIDSIQTTITKTCMGGAGSASQVKEVTHELMNKMKSKGITCFVIGHVTKDGQIAGPKLLEHMVDTVVYFEGEGLGEHRILRAVKNRYGNAREVGLFVMNEKGLSGVSNPIECFAGIHEAPMEGRSLTTIVEGSRVLLIEVQGLVLENKFSQGRRVSQGVEATRLSLLLAVMEKQMGIPFSMSDVFLNIVGGLKVDDRSADLAIMAALWSSLNQLKIDCKTAFIGEMGLNGEVRAGKQIEHRLREAQRAGLSTIFVAASVAKKFKLKTTVNLIGIESIPDLKENLFNR